MAGIGIDVVRAEPCFKQLHGSITFPHGPLPGPEHPHCCRPFLSKRLLELFLHHVECLVPTDGGELATLVVLAVLHSQEGCHESILPVHDLGKEVAFNAVQAFVDRRPDIAVGRHHPAFFGGDLNTAPDAAKAARRL